MTERKTLGIAGVAALALAAAACGTETGRASDAGPAQGDTVLSRLASELTPAVERSAGLAFRRPPGLARASRGALEAFLMGELEEQLPPERADAITAAYARFGLLPDTLDLRSLLRELYLEQVVGYYDPKSDTLFVRREVSPDQLRPVLVHELVHALQDQHQDLDSLMRARRPSNDASTAARAALEGHATYVMMEWQLAERTGRSVDLTELPDLDRLLGSGGLSALASAPALGKAPPIVQQSLVFPYLGGVGFMQRFWREREDRPAPLGDRMPASTEQVLHPGRLLRPEPDRPTEVTFGAPPEAWEERYADGLGELETRILLETFLADSARAREAAAGWDGDAYRLLRGPDGSEALAWVTVWDDAEEAEAFRTAATDAWAGRYADGARRAAIRRVELDGRPAVTVFDAPAGVDEAAGRSALEARLGGSP